MPRVCYKIFYVYINAGCAVVGTVIISCLFVYHMYSSKGATNVLQMPLVEPSPKKVKKQIPAHIKNY